VAAATFEAYCCASFSQLSPLSAAAVGVLLMNDPELSGFCRCYGRVVLRFCGVPDYVDYETHPQAGRDYPQVGSERFKHIFHQVYFCSARIQYVPERTYLVIEYAILRYKRFASLTVQH